MVLMPLQDDKEHKQWKLAFMIMSALLVVIMLFLSKDYGQSGDEWVQIAYGQHIWNYFTTGDLQALNYENLGPQYVGLEYYGGTFDFLMEVFHRWMPSIPLLTVRHFFNALTGGMMMIFTGLLARRLTGKWMIGVLALLFIAFSPRIFGESMNNPKDIPFASGFIIAVYCMVSLLQSFPAKIWKHGIGIALGLGLAFGVRPAGGILLIAYFGLFAILYYYFNKPARTTIFADKYKLLKRLVYVLAGSLVLGYIIGISTWPWGLQEPISNPLIALKGMTNRESYLRVLFEGLYYWSQSLPLYYEFEWIGISNPIVVLLGFVLFILLSFRVKEQYSLFVVIVVLWGALFPLLYMMYKHSTVYDTWRHVFFVYPFWVIAAAIGWDVIATFIKDEKKKWIPAAVAIAGLLPAIVWTVRSHPNQYTYFNEFIGGPKGAYGYYDVDYYQNSGKQAAEWMLKNIKPIPGKKILVRSNMGGFDRYFAKDSSWISYDYGRYGERHWKDWDYYVAYPRYLSTELMQANTWHPQNTIHSVSIDGVPMCLILKRTSNAGTEAFEAYNKQDFETAARKYAEYIAQDTTDEFAFANYGVVLASLGQLDQGIALVKKAIKLDGARPDLYGLLAQMYERAGNATGAKDAQMMQNELTLQQQPPEQEAPEE